MVPEFGHVHPPGMCKILFYTANLQFYTMKIGTRAHSVLRTILQSFYGTRCSRSGSIWVLMATLKV